MDYRQINLIITCLKIISEILASLLSRVIGDLVDVTQSTFIRGRCIMNNIVIAKELPFSLQKCRLPRNTFKEDFA